MVDDAPADAAHREPRRPRGDPDLDGFEFLYKKLYGPIFNYVMRTVMDATAAEDIVSETFLKALQGYRAFTPRGGGGEAWIYRIATNAMLDHFRRRKRAPVVSADSVSYGRLEAQGIIAGDAPDAADRYEEYQRLHRAMESLKTTYRIALVLFYFEGKSIKEIAAIQRCTTVTARWRHHHARKLLAANYTTLPRAE